MIAAVKGKSSDPKRSTELSSAVEMPTRSSVVDNSAFKLPILFYKNLKINNVMKQT